MKKFFLFLFLTFFLSGCASMSMKVYEPLPKTNTIFLGEVNVFQGIGGKPADNDYYQEIVQVLGITGRGTFIA